MSDYPTGNVTQLLRNLSSSGGQQAGKELLEVVYGELRHIARHIHADEFDQQTWQTTALVHEAYIRLVGSENIQWECRAHFFSAAAEAMRRILIDEAHKRATQKRGGKWRRLTINSDDLPASDNSPIDLLALNEALLKLEQQAERVASIVKLRFFAGLTIEETALAMGLSTRTVNRDWLGGRAWLHSELIDNQLSNETPNGN